MLVLVPYRFFDALVELSRISAVPETKAARLRGWKRAALARWEG